MEAETLTMHNHTVWTWLQPGGPQAFYTEHFWAFLGSVVAYPFVIFGLQHYMKDKKPFDLRGPLVLWNFGLAVFSLLGAIATVPPLFERLSKRSVGEDVCDPLIFLHPAYKWVFWFNVSKVVEFGDTLFIVLRKKPLIFLHWYHHIVTMLFCWYANQHDADYHGAGWYFASMNLTVHAMMYSYYGFTAMGYRMSWNTFLTTCQILQMVAGIYIVYQTSQCSKVNHTEVAFGGLMYFSYFVLFAQFFVDKYIRKQSPTSSKSLKAKKAE